MRWGSRVLTFAGALAAVLLVGRGAGAYVRSVSDASPYPPLYWSSSCETVTIYLNGFTAMTPDEVAKSIAGAAAAWGPDVVTCPSAVGDGGSGHPSFEIIPQLATSGAAPTVPKNDGKNTIVFQTADWGNNPPEALAFTSVWKEPSGHIVDADIEINATAADAIAWANLDPGAPPAGHGIQRYDLQTVMTHEFGHFLGLAHTCIGNTDDGSNSPMSDKDAQGQDIPPCSDYPDSTAATQAAAIMWFEVTKESIAKRVLTTDDARGVCAIYPPTRASPSCAQNLPDDGCGCAAAGSGSTPLAGIALAALLLAAGRRRQIDRR